MYYKYILNHPERALDQPSSPIRTIWQVFTRGLRATLNIGPLECACVKRNSPISNNYKKGRGAENQNGNLR